MYICSKTNTAIDLFQDKNRSPRRHGRNRSAMLVIEKNTNLTGIFFSKANANTPIIYLSTILYTYYCYVSRFDAKIIFFRNRELSPNN